MADIDKIKKLMDFLNFKEVTVYAHYLNDDESKKIWNLRDNADYQELRWHPDTPGELRYNQYSVSCHNGDYYGEKSGVLKITTDISAKVYADLYENATRKIAKDLADREDRERALARKTATEAHLNSLLGWK